MSYDIEITTHEVSYHDADGEWMDGDQRELSPADTVTETYDPDSDDGTPVDWAVERAAGTDAYEPSTDPIPDEAPEHLWLSGTYSNPTNTDVTETTVRLTGGWTPAERAEVFRRVYAYATGRDARRA